MAYNLLQPLVALVFIHIAGQPHDMRSGYKAPQVVEIGQQATFVIAYNLPNRDLTALQHLFSVEPILLL